MKPLPGGGWCYWRTCYPQRPPRCSSFSWETTAVQKSRGRYRWWHGLAGALWASPQHLCGVKTPPVVWRQSSSTQRFPTTEHTDLSLQLWWASRSYLLLITFWELSAATQTRPHTIAGNLPEAPWDNKRGSTVPFRLFQPPSLHSQQTVYSSPPSCSRYSAPKGKHARKYFSKGEKEANFYDGENMFGCLTSSRTDAGFPRPARPFRSSWCCKPATQGTFRPLHTKVRRNAGFRWESASAASRFVPWPPGLTVNPITHSSQAPHSSQSTELSLFSLWLVLF